MAWAGRRSDVLIFSTIAQPSYRQLKKPPSLFTPQPSAARAGPRPVCYSFGINRDFSFDVAAARAGFEARVGGGALPHWGRGLCFCC
jgi:hypothetical protein